MASLTPSKIPILNFSGENLKPGTAGWIAMTFEVRKALEEFGCFEAVYDLVPSEAHTEMFAAMEDLFNLPDDTKEKYVHKSRPDCTYLGRRPSAPLNEAMGITDAAAVESFSSFTTLMWPEGNPKFCKTMHSYVHRLMRLEQMVKRMTYESFGLERYCPSSESTDYAFRLMLYTPQKNETIGASAHTDKSALTILHQNHVDGFETQTKNGEWLSVSPSPNSFIVVIGEPFMAWSNGRLYCPLHRVTIKGDGKRYSVGLITSNKELIETPEELVDEEHPLLFKPFNQMAYLRFYMANRAKLGDITLKDYCGV